MPILQLSSLVSKYCKRIDIYKLLLMSLVIILLFIQISNIGYNSPSADEAVYISIGHSTIFHWNWSLYNTASWLGGHPYFYPVISTLAYQTYGIGGTRLLNILFLLLSLYWIYKITFTIGTILNMGKDRSRIAAISGLVLLGFNSASLYISKLATYDMPSFAFLIGALYFLILAVLKNSNTAKTSKLFFVSAILTILSFAFKYIVAIYIPLMIGLSFLYLRHHKKSTILHLWKYYFLAPISIVLILIGVTQFQYLLTYGINQISREHFGWNQIISTMFQSGTLIAILPFVILSIIFFLIKKHRKSLVLLIGSALIILAFHLVFNRVSTSDKHVFLFVTPIAALSGLGISYLYLTLNKLTKLITMSFITILLFLYCSQNIASSQQFRYYWPNYNASISYIEKNLNLRDKLLSESAVNTLTSTVQNIRPENLTTFDWFVYSNYSGDEAYARSVREGYFNYIELEGSNFSKTDHYKKINEIIRNNMDNNYYLVFSDTDIYIYKRVF